MRTGVWQCGVHTWDRERRERVWYMGGWVGGLRSCRRGGKAGGTDESWWEKGVRRVSEWVLAAWL